MLDEQYIKGVYLPTDEFRVRRIDKLSDNCIGVNKHKHMKKILANLIGKKFSVYVGGEFERMTDFIGFIKLLTNYSDFWNYTKSEQYEKLKNAVTERVISIDCNIFVKIGK